MSEPDLISPAPPESTSMDYAALRKGGIERIQQLAELTWTDHNVHDPGITLLEAFCYAMTELGFRTRLDMADLLRSGEARAPSRLVPAHLVLPTAPVTIGDLRKLLFDHPRIGDALVAVGAATEQPFFVNPGAGAPFTFSPNDAPVSPRGLSEVLIAFGFDDRELNSNTYSASDTYPGTVEFDGQSYAVEVALPHWDEPQAAAFRAGATVDAVAMTAPDGVVWRELPEEQSFFGTLEVTVDPDGPVDLWALLQISDPVRPADLAGVLAAAEALVETTGAGSLIEEFAVRVRAADAAVNQVERFVGGWRNLCEQAVTIAAAREQEIAVTARIEVTRGTDLERLLADIFLAIDRELSPPLSFHSLREMRDRGHSTEEIFDGPLLAHGFLDDEELSSVTPPSAIYLSDVLRLIMQLRGTGSGDVVAQENPSGRDIIAVTDLRLSNFVNNRPITTDARNCLRLVETDRYRPRLSLPKSEITFVRDEVPVPYDRDRVARLFAEGQQRDRDQALTDDPSPVLPQPAGEELPVADYYPFQNDLPRLYGLGEAGLPESAGGERRARALQAKGYLILFEQFLADLAEQLGSINRFFSPAPDEVSTYFTQPLVGLPGLAGVLRQGLAEHRRALQQAAEDRDRFLDRRNRMLDHLLARLGEQTVAWAQELHRWGQAELDPSAIAETELGAVIAARRQAVNARLIRDKAAFLGDLPWLAAFRLQSFGTVLHRRPGILRVEQQGTSFRWLLSGGDGGPDRLQSPELFASPALAAAAGADAAVLAAGPLYRQGVIEGVRRYRLFDAPGGAGRVVGESPDTFGSASAAQTAMIATRRLFEQQRLDLSLTPLERRVAHLIGIRSQLRRIGFLETDELFDVVDSGGGDGRVDGWRLRAGPSPGDAVLLLSDSFPPAGEPAAASDAEAEQLARAAIAAAIRYGGDAWSYRVGEDLRIELHDPAGELLARSPEPFESAAEAEAAIAAVVDHLYQSYGNERFHLVEHLLLRPRGTNDRFLDLPAGEESDLDPYSQRLSLVFPSGFARLFPDSDQPDAEPPPPTPVAPHRFRDPEFRRHAELMVRQACPAHLLPSIYWVDRDLATMSAPETFPQRGSFDEFERRYHEWLRSILGPGMPPAGIRNRRIALVLALNAVAGNAAT